jgi:hypothetical protein
MTDRDRVKGLLAALRGMGMGARHAWVGSDFGGVQVDLAGLPSREWYGPDGMLWQALPLAMPLDLAKYVVPAAERAGLLAVSCPFYDLGLVWLVAAGDTAEADRVRTRWEAEVAADPDALRGLSVEDTYRLGRMGVAA